MAKKFTVRCPECGVNFTATFGFMHRKDACPKCKRVINLKNEASNVISCPHCGGDSAYNALKGAPTVCLVCGQSLEDPAIKARYRDVNCPKCGHPHTLLPGSGVHECIACGAAFDVDQALNRMTLVKSDAVTTFEQNDAPGMLVWKHPISSFPYNAQLNVKSGTRAICSLGGGPLFHGAHALKEVLSGLLPEIPGDKGNQLIRTDVYFARESIDLTFPWGTGNCPTFPGASVNKSYEVTANGNMMLRITDPSLLLDFIGYGEYTVKDVVGNMDAPVRAMVRGVINDAFSNVCTELLRNSAWTVERIDEHSVEVKQGMIDNINMLLDGYGLQLAFFDLTEVSPRLSSYSNNRANLLRTIRHQLEAGIEWETAAPVRIHMRDAATRYADLTLGGKIILRVLDENKVMDKADVWVLDDTSGTGVRRYLSYLFSSMVLNPLHDILQAMINETNADIRELTPYYYHLRNTMENYLNNTLREWGMEVSVFMLHQSKFIPSDALRTLTQNAAVMDTKTLEAQLADFTRNLDFTEYAAKAEDKTKRLGVDLGVKQQEVGFQIASMQLDSQLEDAKAQAEMQRQTRNAAVVRHGKDIVASQRNIDARQQAEQDILELDIAAHIAERRGQLSAAEQQRAYDQMYIRWKNNARLEQEKLNDQMQRDNAIQDHNIYMDSRTQEAVRAQERADAEQQRILAGIMRSIEQSDFDWQQKQDAYARLLRTQHADDRARVIVQQARAETDAEYLRNHLKLKLTDEEAQLLENIARNEEARIERARRAEFAQEMEQRRQETGLQMELLRIEFEQQEKLADAAKEIAAQKAEMEKLRLTLQHYENMGRQGLEETRVRENGATARHQAELAYQQRFAASAQKEEADRRAAQEAAENSFADRAERLLTTMWSIQASLDGMQLENEREFHAGRARVDQTAAQRMSDSQLRQLTDRIDGISKRLAGLSKTVRNQNSAPQTAPTTFSTPVAPAAPAAPVTPVTPTTFGAAPQSSMNPAFGGSCQFAPHSSGLSFTAPTLGYQPATTLTCPRCGRSVSSTNNFCPHCAQNLK